MCKYLLDIKGAGSREGSAVSGLHAGAKRAVKVYLSLPPGMEVPRLMELEGGGSAIRGGCASVPHPEPFQPSQEGECCLISDVRCPGERLSRS